MVKIKADWYLVTICSIVSTLGTHQKSFNNDIAFNMI